MTRKDYVLIAAALHDSLQFGGEDIDMDTACAHQHANCTRAVADALAQDNPRFDRARFLAACGVTA